MIDNFNDFDTCQVFEPQSTTETSASDPVDLDEYNSCTIVWNVGTDAALDGSNYWTLTLTEADTVGGSYTTVAAADIVDGTTSPTASVVVDSTSEDSKAYKLGYIGNARFLKGVITETGALTGPVGLTMYLGNKRMGPTSQASVAIAS